MNKLLFRTKLGGVTTAPGTSLHLGFVDVSKEERKSGIGGKAGDTVDVLIYGWEE